MVMQFRLPEDSVQPVKNMVAVYYLNAIENDKAYGKRLGKTSS